MCFRYCENDVFICAKGTMKFRELVFEVTGVDPIREASTIASTTNLVFRANFLLPDTIALIPPGGYRKDNQSIKALKWLRYLSEKRGVRIQHARNGGEKTVKAGPHSFKVDGYYEENGEKVSLHFCLSKYYVE